MVCVYIYIYIYIYILYTHHVKCMHNETSYRSINTRTFDALFIKLRSSQCWPVSAAYMLYTMSAITCLQILVFCPLQVSKRFYELMQLFNEQPSDPSENDSDIESDGSPVG